MLETAFGIVDRIYTCFGSLPLTQCALAVFCCENYQLSAACRFAIQIKRKVV